MGINLLEEVLKNKLFTATGLIIFIGIFYYIDTTSSPWNNLIHNDCVAKQKYLNKGSGYTPQDFLSICETKSREMLSPCIEEYNLQTDSGQRCLDRRYNAERLLDMGRGTH